MRIKPNDRVFVVGKSGCGKSYFVLNVLVPTFRYYVVYDYKCEIELPGAVIFTSPDDFKKTPGMSKIVYRPTMGTDEEFNELCGVIYNRGNTMFVIDEVFKHATQHRIQPNHEKILRLGRTLGVGHIACTQEPVRVHSTLMTQAEHYFIFDIPDDEHRKKLSGYTGMQVRKRVQDFYFWYYGVGMRDPVLVDPIKVNKPILPVKRRPVTGA